MNNAVILNRINKLEDAITVLQMELTSFKAELSEKPITKDNTSNLLLSCGFLCLEEMEGKEAKTLITFINNTVKPELETEEIEKVIKRIADLNAKKPVRNKYSYLISCFKNELKDKGAKK